MGRAVEALFSSACPLPGGTLLVRNDETADAGEAPSGPMVLTSDASVQVSIQSQESSTRTPYVLERDATYNTVHKVQR